MFRACVCENRIQVQVAVAGSTLSLPSDALLVPPQCIPLHPLLQPQFTSAVDLPTLMEASGTTAVCTVPLPVCSSNLKVHNGSLAFTLP